MRTLNPSRRWPAVLALPALLLLGVPGAQIAGAAPATAAVSVTPVPTEAPEGSALDRLTDPTGCEDVLEDGNPCDPPPQRICLPHQAC
ncbi:MAG TPA: hypothetical protein VG245_00880 [Candidatus Dormibacteraeota bacterium]|jgi:hypothetical protein|nr:hypothetical protein [Candidatus Dormibacteraeota bacterium]